MCASGWVPRPRRSAAGAAAPRRQPPRRPAAGIHRRRSRDVAAQRAGLVAQSARRPVQALWLERGGLLNRNARAASAYKQVDAQTRSPLELVVMLYDGVLSSLSEA